MISRKLVNIISSVVFIFLVSYLLSELSLHTNSFPNLQQNLKLYTHLAREFFISPTPVPPSPREAKAYTPPQQIAITTVPKRNQEEDEWGVARQIDEHTYTIRVGSDDRMGTRDEVLAALNQYRAVNGAGALVFDDRLNNYAQSRADHFVSIKSTDAHAGFNDYLENNHGFEALGFARLGENSYYGGPLYGVHLIEWVFAKSPGHNANQIDKGWTHVGIGVTGLSANLIFGANQI